MNFLHSQNFIKKFKKVLQKLYLYESYMDFLIVPSILGKKTLSYLPLLNYTDRAYDNINDLMELSGDSDFQIRTLNFEYNDFQEDDTVSMRLDIDNRSSEDILKNVIKSKKRNKINRAIKRNDFLFEYGNSKKNIEDFYLIFSQTVYKHGTPVLDKKLFYYLVEEFGDNITFYNVYDGNKVIASMCMMFDDGLAWYPWGGVHKDYNKKLAGYFIYWQVLKHVCDTKNIKIFDFGRSSYGGNTYNFKSQFGAKPVKIDIITSQDVDIYSRYSFASNIWKKLPKNVVDLIGPKLCKYLVDL